MKKIYSAISIGIFLMLGCNGPKTQSLTYSKVLTDQLGDSVLAFEDYVNNDPLKDSYLYPIIESLLNKETLLNRYPDSAIYYQDLATKVSYLGLIKSSIEIYQKSSSLNIVSIDTDIIEEEQPSKWLNNVMRENRTVMFNEAHHIPAHRATLLYLLPEFYAADYRKLGLETLRAEDQMRLNQERFPIQSSGTYTIDPVFANTVRLALKLGFQVLAYEASLGSNSNRELEQATNLSRIDTSYHGKLLVLAGYGHIREQPRGDWRAMASYFAEMSGHNPYTIDQTAIVVDQPESLHPFIPTHESQPFLIGRFRGYVDAQIIYPLKYFTDNGHRLDNSSYFRRLVLPVPQEKSVLQQTYSAEEADRYDLEQLIPLDQNLIGSDVKYHSVPKWYDEFIYVERDIYGKIIEKVVLTL